MQAWKSSVVKRILTARSWKIDKVPSKVYRYIYDMSTTCVGRQLESSCDFGVGLAVGAVFSVMTTVYSKHVCAECGAEPCTNVCSKCSNVWYCSKKCQKSHWRPVHKSECLLMCASAVVPCGDIPERICPQGDDARFTTPELMKVHLELCKWSLDSEV